MKTLNVMLSNLGGRVVPIGYEGENLYTRIRINCIEVFADYPDATVSMVVNSPVGQMYPAVIEKSGIMVIWDITDAVLSSNGSGECQLTFTDGDVVRKSVVFGISINRSLIASGDPPEPVQEWIDKAEQTAQEIAENAANLAKEDIVESYGSIAPAIIETASGAIASFSDGADGMLVKTLNVDIDPVQDLHGYDNPWPAGGGKNLFNKDGTYEENKVIRSDGTIAASGSSDPQTLFTDPIYVLPSTDYVVSGTADSSKYIRVAEYSSNGTFIKRNLSSKQTSIEMSFTTDENTAYVLVNPDTPVTDIQLELGSTATEYTPYANVCPISGWTSADVTGTGSNLFDKTAVTYDKYINSDGDIISNGSWSISDYIPVNAGGSVSYKGLTNVGSAPHSAFYDIGKNLVSTFKQATGENTQSVPLNAKYVRFSVAYTAEERNNFAVATGTSVGDYEAFAGETYTYPFPQSAGTVYGGTDTIYQDGTRTLVVSKDESDLGSLTWTKYDGTGYADLYYTDDLTTQIGATSGDVPHGICSEFAVVDNATHSGVDGGSIAQPYNTIRFRSMDGRVYLKVAGYSTAAEMTQAVSGVQLVYELANPVTYDLTAQQVVSLLKGTNNVWADTGDVDLEYPADTKLYIDARVAELQALILENISNS